MIHDSPESLPPSVGKALALAVGFGILGYLGNLVHLPFGFNLALIFGSIFTLTATALLGWRWGLLSTLVASFYTYILWNHPYAIVILGAETLWVGLALRRGHRNLLLIVTPFWLLVGIPLVFLFYGGIQHLGFQITLATALKQAINGFINSLIAGSLLRYLPLESWLGLSSGRKRYALAAAVFDISLLLLLVPSVALIITASRREILLGEQRVVTHLSTEATFREGLLYSWVERQNLAMTSVAALESRLGTSSATQLQSDLRQVHALTPDCRNLFLTDVQGRSVLFDPPLSPQGVSNLGLEFADHPWFQRVKSTLKPEVSEVFMGSRAAFQPIFTISVPVMAEGRVRGYAGGAVNLANLEKLLTQSQGADPPSLLLVDASNHIVLSTDLTRHPLEPLADPSGTRVQPITDHVSLHIPPPRKNVSPMEVWNQAHYTTQIAVRGTPWTLRVLRPAGPLQVRGYSLIIASLAWLGGTFLMALLLARLVAGALVGAFARLTTFSRDLPRQVESGQALAWPETRFEEIAQMTANLRTTSEALGERIQQLKVETDRRIETERLMTHQARLAAMGEMLANIAHQWRQPLNFLSMLLANMRDGWRQAEPDRERLEQDFSTGQEQIQKMSSTISDFMNFFRPEKEMSTFSCLQQIRAVLALMKASFQSAHIEILIEAEGDVLLCGYPNEYSQVLLNLICNAKQAIMAASTCQETSETDPVWPRKLTPLSRRDRWSIKGEYSVPASRGPKCLNPRRFEGFSPCGGSAGALSGSPENWGLPETRSGIGCGMVSVGSTQGRSGPPC